MIKPWINEKIAEQTLQGKRKQQDLRNLCKINSAASANLCDQTVKQLRRRFLPRIFGPTILNTVPATAKIS